MKTFTIALFFLIVCKTCLAGSIVITVNNEGSCPAWLISSIDDNGPGTGGVGPYAYDGSSGPAEIDAGATRTYTFTTGGGSSRIRTGLIFNALPDGTGTPFPTGMISDGTFDSASGSGSIDTGSSCAPCTTNVSYSFHNSDSMAHSVKVSFASGATFTLFVDAYATAADYVTLPCSDVGTAKYVVVPSVRDNTTNTIPVTLPDGTQTNETQVNSPDDDNGNLTTNSDGSFTITGNTGQVYNTTNSGDSNPIVWSHGSSSGDEAGTAQAVKDGDKALYDALTKGFQQNHRDLRGINSAVTAQKESTGVPTTNAVTIVGGSGSSNVWVQNWPTSLRTNMDLSAEKSLVGISNLLSGITESPSNTDIATEGTQVGILSALTNMANGHWTNGTAGPTNYATESTLDGISNLLASTRGQTNGVTNGVLASMAGLIPDTVTNASAALAAAGAAEGDYGADSLISSLTPTLPDESVAAPDMTMSFAGTTIDLDPSHEFPTAAAFSLVGMRIVLLLIFLMEIARMFWQIVKVKASTSSGGVPDLDVFGGINILGSGLEAGGNFIGVGVAVITPFIFIAIFSAVMAYLFANIGISVAEAMNVRNFQTSMGGMGYYILSSFFPVNLCFSLICTRIVLQFTLGKITALATDAARFLWGK